MFVQQCLSGYGAGCGGRCPTPHWKGMQGRKTCQLVMARTFSSNTTVRVTYTMHELSLLVLLFQHGPARDACMGLKNCFQSQH